MRHLTGCRRNAESALGASPSDLTLLHYRTMKLRRNAAALVQILGGNGYVNEYPTGRLLRDAKLYEIGAGTSEIRRMLIGRELFKESKP